MTIQLILTASRPVSGGKMIDMMTSKQQLAEPLMEVKKSSIRACEKSGQAVCCGSASTFDPASASDFTHHLKEYQRVVSGGWVNYDANKG